jgi:hypothetical protein
MKDEDIDQRYAAAYHVAGHPFEHDAQSANDS